MWESLVNAVKLPDLRKKLLFTAIIIALYRLGCYIPSPGVDPGAFTLGGGGVLDLMNLFGGGGLQNTAIFALGIMPYITASIIMQLLTMVSKRLEAMMKEGPAGQKKMNQYTRYFTGGLALIESIGFVFLFDKGDGSAGSRSAFTGGLTFTKGFLVVLTLTVGAIMVMWLGELITQRGIGNGISLMIFASIVSRLPGGLVNMFRTMHPALWVVMALIAVAVIVFVIFVTQGQRRIPVQYAKRVVGRKVYGGQSTYLPLRVNMAGVIPVIFASSLLLLPVTLARMVPWGWTQKLAEIFGPGSWWYLIVEIILIIIFTYFYTAVQFNPIDQADNLKKYGGFVPGIRPGRPTAAYLDRVLTRITLPGALFLGAIVLLPSILYKVMHVPFYFGGTSILIVIGVALDTMQQMESQLLMRHYEGFLK
jgi:preprotein translocase subunit SecY